MNLDHKSVGEIAEESPEGASEQLSSEAPLVERTRFVAAGDLGRAQGVREELLYELGTIRIHDRWNKAGGPSKRYLGEVFIYGIPVGQIVSSSRPEVLTVSKDALAEAFEEKDARDKRAEESQRRGRE